MMRKLGDSAAVCAAVMLVCACSKGPPEPGDVAPAAPSKAADPGAGAAVDPAADPLAGVTLEPRREGLRRTARTFVERIGELENRKDVTCWMSFRQLDNFIAEKTYSDAATLTKIIASKTLVQGAWVAASQRAAGDEVTAADLEAIVGQAVVELPEEKKVQLQKFGETMELQEFRDYRTTSEHWRVVLAIAQDELGRGQPEVKPLSADGIDALALFATRVGLSLLTESGEIATEARAPLIEPPHVQKAYENLRTKLAVPEHTPAKIEGDAAVATALRAEVTGQLIDVKVAALQTYNDATDLHAALGRISKVPVSAAATTQLVAQLSDFARFFARGYEPMRGDNYLADGNFAPGEGPGRDYIDAGYVENAIMQRFPHVMMPNGDLKLRFELRPGHVSARDLEAQDVTLLDHHMNAVRDTAIHWVVLDRVFDEQAFAMDPFAAEYLSEIVSVLATFYMRRAQTQARASGAAEITAEHIRQAEDVGYAMVMPQVEATREWGAEQQAAKDAALAGYRAPLFADATAAWGLPTTLPGLAATSADPGDAGFDIQEVMGSGIAVGDVDGDGWTDMFMAGPGLHKLWRNGGEAAPGQFTDVSAKWGIIGGADDGRGALMVDFDGDGDLDLFVARSRNPSELYENVGGRFEEVAAKRGLVTGRGAHVGVWFDYDGDDDLDLYLGYYGSAACNRGECAGRNLPALDGRNGTPNQLFRNDGGTFVEVGAAAKVADPGWTLAASTFDYDGDGDLDLYLANDFGANPLLRNEGDGTFVDVAEQLGAADRGSGMNVSFTDLEGDGDFDVYVSNIDMFSKTIKIVFPSDESLVSLDDRVLRAFQYLSGNKLYENEATADGGRRFVSVEGLHFEPGDRGWGWGAPFFDYENDGDEDMYLTNGWIPGSPAADQNNQMFLRDAGMFYRAPASSPEAFAGNSRAVVAFDADHDGDLDLAVNNYTSPPRLLRNEQSTGKRWVKVRLKGTGVNTRAIGAVLVARAGGLTMRRQVTCGVGYLGQDDEVMNLGLGKATKADVYVSWPGGTTERFEGLAAGTTHELTQGSGK
jgi:hypothetical protein